LPVRKADGWERLVFQGRILEHRHRVGEFGDGNKVQRKKKLSFKEDIHPSAWVLKVWAC
jgi:hypothetical protein